MRIFNKSLVALLMAGAMIFTSCQKDISGDEDPQPTNPDPVDVSLNDRIKDTTLLYAQDIYLWYNQIPSGFKPRTYADPDKIMTAIRQYSTEPGFTGPVDRWSFAVKQQEWDDVSSGIAGDFGINVFFKAEGDLRVRYVEKQSPAGKAGVRRGWKITKLNGSANITTGNASAIVEAVYNSTNTVFEFQKPDGSVVTSNLAVATYQQDPVFFDSVYTAGVNKVGYFVFNSFLGDTSQIYNNFQRIFNRFSSENVKDVVIDLRYNGGGYVSVQEKLANYLVKPSASGQLMMKEEFNVKYRDWNETINFSKVGSLAPNRLFFIVSDNTASASELLINNLKPYAEVKLVGPSATYGKPVGYFPIPVGDWYIFPVSFRSTNKDGQGNYFDGIALDSRSADGLDKDWGDVQETSLGNVLNYIATGDFKPLSAGRSAEAPAQVIRQNKIFSDRSFKGAIIRTRTMKK
ncbi:MAG: hypothetical protein EOO04_17780 [Chitinophagaceae bacterium]|nr:MAG: hypothetical protein EOO04_17780 [Chitinophagaceae bacterium]